MANNPLDFLPSDAHIDRKSLSTQLSESIRESFVLFALEEFGSDEVAMLIGKPLSLVLKDAEKSRGQLRRQTDQTQAYWISNSYWRSNNCQRHPTSIF